MLLPLANDVKNVAVTCHVDVAAIGLEHSADRRPVASPAVQIQRKRLIAWEVIIRVGGRPNSARSAAQAAGVKTFEVAFADAPGRQTSGSRASRG